MESPRIYLDHHAATPLCRASREAMYEAMADLGNPSSVHHEGRAQRRRVERARAEVAAAVASRPSGVIFTSGGTEACNLGVLGLARDVRRIVTTRIEHPAVERAVASLVASGRERTFIEVAASGDIALDALDHADPQTLVVCQWINHETGHELPVHEISRRARSRGARLFVDATQALGKRAIDLGALGATAVALASHKIGGPAGAGALVIEAGAAIDPIVLGGAQEHGLRGGTPDVVSLAGFGAAAACTQARVAAMSRIGALRDALEAALVGLGGVLNAPTKTRAETVTSVAFPAWRADWLVAALDAEGIACASGAACSSGVVARSPVVAALFPDEPWRAGASLRISLGVETTAPEVHAAIAILEKVIPRAA